MSYVLDDRPQRNFCFLLQNMFFVSFSDEETHMDVHDRALLYYRLLKTNTKEVL